MANSPYTYTTPSGYSFPCFPGAYLVDTFGGNNAEVLGSFPIYTSFSAYDCSYLTIYTTYGTMLILPGYKCSIGTSANKYMNINNTSSTDMSYVTFSTNTNFPVNTNCNLFFNNKNITVPYSTSSATSTNPKDWFTNMTVVGAYVCYGAAWNSNLRGIYPIHGSYANYSAQIFGNANANTYMFLVLPGFKLVIEIPNNVVSNYTAGINPGVKQITTTPYTVTYDNTNGSKIVYYDDLFVQINNPRLYYCGTEITGMYSGAFT